MKTPLLAGICLLIAATTHAAPVKVALFGDTPAVNESLSKILSSANHAMIPKEQANTADVIILASAEPKPIPGADRTLLESLAKRGAGIIVLGSAIGAGDAAWFKPLTGGAWVPTSRKFMNRLMWCPLTDAHPITSSLSLFDLDDETLYDLDTVPEINVLASTFTPKVTSKRIDPRSPENPSKANVYDLQPQLWTYEAPDQHRATVLLQGGAKSLSHKSIETTLLRSIAWCAKRPLEDAAWPNVASDTLRYPKDGPRTASDTIRSFEIHPGFKASTIAAEPLINKPIAIQWDAKGRLWVAETVEYPNGRRPLTAEPWKETGVLLPGKYDRPARDRISILSDPDSHGVFTKKTVFHEGLELITGFCLYRDGAIVVGQPDIVFLHDKNGDDKADSEDRLFTGFTPGDTHFVANHFQVAPDGWIYADTGSGPDVSSITHPAVKTRLSSGMFRFKPDGSAIEQVSSKGGNSFGGEFTSDGEVFFNQATSGNPIQHVVLSEKVLAKGKVGNASSAESVIKGRQVIRDDMPDRAPLMQIDQVGRYSSACASSVYEAGAWPDAWSNSVFTTEPILDIIHHERLVPAGPTFTGQMTRENAEWLRSRDHWFFPVAVEFGPDGAMYVLDFYCPVVAHSDTRGPQHSKASASIRPDRDHYFGRIYRIQHDEAKPLAVPDLSRATAKELVNAFRHPNKHIRFTAHRLLMDRSDVASVREDLTQAATGADVNAKLLALWALRRSNLLNPETLLGAMENGDARVRKVALHIAGTSKGWASPIAARLEDPNPRVRLTALAALATADEAARSGDQPIPAPNSTETKGTDVAKALLKTLPKLEDDWSRSAAAAAANSNALAILETILTEDNASSPAVSQMAQSLAQTVAERGEIPSIFRAVKAASLAPNGNAPVARLVLETLASRPLPASSPTDSIDALAASRDEALRHATLPFAVAWKASSTLIDSLTNHAKSALADANRSLDQRISAARALIRSRIGDASVRSAIKELLEGKPADPLALETIAALSETGDPSVSNLLLRSLATLTNAPQTAAIDALVGRPQWAMEVIHALKEKTIQPALLGPARLGKLSRHADREVAKRALQVFDEIGAGSNPAKNAIITKLLPEVERGTGDESKGKTAFNAACSVCHLFKGEGKNVGPALDGIGVHGANELLTHIIDPSRVVDNEHRTWSIALKNGSFATGIVSRENDRTVTLTLAGGVQQDIRTADIKSRQDTGVSLMPEGFEALGADTLRDILAYLAGGSGKNRFRAINLTKHFTTDTLHGLYQSREAKGDTIHPEKFGIVTVEGVPFSLPDPSTTPTGGNALVLKGGGARTFAATLPKQVEIPVGFAAGNVHFLGAVAGWGGGPEMKRPAMKLTIEHENGKKQIEELGTGDVFIDYVSSAEVPGSKRVNGVVKRHHVRYFSLPVQDRSPVLRLVLESYDNGISPTTLAITADNEPPKQRQKFAPTPKSASAEPPTLPKPAGFPLTGETLPEKASAGTVRALLIGGGSSHDFEKFFRLADSATLREAGKVIPAYTSNLEEALSLFARADVIVLSANHGQFGTPQFQNALNAFADSGRGLVIVHAGGWYNWPPISGYNKRFVAGGARGHGRGDFKVFNRAPEHPVMKGVPAEFMINDEHYRSILDVGTAFEMLAETEVEKATDKAYPAVWSVKDAKARIINISLGHAQEAHNNPAYKLLLKNAVEWCGGR
jgi:putative membrane-bound dehydrogenase-like protein